MRARARATGDTSMAAAAAAAAGWGICKPSDRGNSIKWSRLPFPAFYFLYSLGIVISSLCLGLVLGSDFYDKDSEHRDFIKNLKEASLLSYVYAFLSGALFNVANFLLVLLIGLIGLATSFPICIGIALVVGTLLSYVIEPANTSLGLLLLGVGLAMCALLCMSASHVFKNRALEADEKRKHLTETDWTEHEIEVESQPISFNVLIGLCVLCGVVMGAFAPLETLAQQSTNTTAHSHTDNFICKPQSLPSQEGQPLRGNDNFGAATREQCCNMCQAEAQCNGLAWPRAGSGCYLKQGFNASTVTWKNDSTYDFCYLFSSTNTTNRQIFMMDDGSGNALHAKANIQLVTLAGRPELVASTDGTDDRAGRVGMIPYTCSFVFTIAAFVTSIPLCWGLARCPLDGAPVASIFGAIGNGSAKDVVMPFVASAVGPGAFTWALGTTLNFVSGGEVSQAVAYSIAQAAPMVAVLWGLLVFEEFKGAPCASWVLLGLMFCSFGGAIVSIALASGSF